MALEIERKFLVISDAWRALAYKQVEMRHGYLNDPDQNPGAAPGPQAATRASVRVRLEDETGKLNVKAAVAGIARAEYEYEIPAAEAREMLETLCAGLILKTRYYVHAESESSDRELVWEVDEFAGANRGLMVAEIELPHLNQTFMTPSWLGREVTHERRYYNHALAIRPYCDWPADERS